jgi:outer membrane translocation and assembly module TamA
VEVRFPVLGENLGGVLFEDAGNVYSRLGKLGFRVQQRDVTDFDYMVHAVGFGVRYRTPVGPVRVDVGWALNPPNFVGFKGTREQLLFGGGLRTQQQIGHFQFHFSLGQAF